MLCERGSDKGGRGSKNVTHFCDITYGWSLSLYDRRKPRSSCGGAEALPSASLPSSLSINLALSECHFIGAALLLRCHEEARVGRLEEKHLTDPQSKVYVIASMCLIVI